MRSAHARILAPALALALGACFPAPAPAPTYARVDPAQIAAVALRVLDGATTYCAASDPIGLTATVTLTDGRTLEMAAYASERGLPTTAFEWTTSWGRIDAGQLALPADPFAALDRDVTVEVGVVDRPDLRAQVTLAPSYRCAYGYAATGAYGPSGASGYSGTSGRSGASGSASQRAGDGEDGQAGEHGGDGGNGGAGHLLRAFASYVDTPRHGRLGILLVVDGDARRAILFDPAGPHPVLGSFGGGGGGGGTGGRGGDGGAGGSYSDATVDGDGGNGGNGGAGGDGGDGGDGGPSGELELVYDRRFPELATLVDTGTGGGAAGAAGDGGWGGSAGGGGSTSRGRSGQPGHEGPSGRRGREGRPGPDGAPPRVTPGDVGRELAFVGEHGLGLSR